MKNMKRMCVLLGFGVAAVSLSAAPKLHFDSQRRDGAIVVDAKFDDWYGNLQPFGDDPVSIQFLNDADFLYVRLRASDPGERMQIMRQGLTVWFDPLGGTKKRFGIKYPVVERGGPDDQGRGGRGGRGGFGGARPRRGGGDTEGEGQDAPDDSAAPSDRVDIIGPGKDDARSLTRDHLSGADVAIRVDQGVLQYELRIPLARSADHPYAIETAPGKTIGVGLETPKMEQRSSSMGRGGGFGGGGGGGGFGGGGRGRGGGGMGRGGGGRGGGESQRRPEAAKPLKGWATVTIAPVR